LRGKERNVVTVAPAQNSRLRGKPRAQHTAPPLCLTRPRASPAPHRRCSDDPRFWDGLANFQRAGTCHRLRLHFPERPCLYARPDSQHPEIRLPPRVL